MPQQVIDYLGTADWSRVIEVAAIVAAAFAGIAAWRVANRATGIAADARDAEKAQAQVAAEALRATRIQSELQAVPNLVASLQSIQPPRPGNSDHRVTVRIVNGGPTAAYGVIASVALATKRDVDAADEATRGASRREAGVAPGGDVSLGAKLSTFGGEWIAVRVEYYTPLGASVRHDYMYGLTNRKWRLHRVTITPTEGPPLTFNLRLGPGGDEDDEGTEPDKPPAFGGVA